MKSRDKSTFPLKRSQKQKRKPLQLKEIA